MSPTTTRDQVRRRAARRADRALGQADELLAEAGEQIDSAAGAIEDAGRLLGSLLRGVVRVAALLPAGLAGLLGFVARVLDPAADRGRQVAQQVESPRTERRRPRSRSAMWFAGGFVSGAVAGWLVRDRTGAGPRR